MTPTRPGYQDVLDFLTSVGHAIDLQAAVLIIIFLIGAHAFTRVVTRPQTDGSPNPIEFWHFFASRAPGPDGKQWGDPAKLAVMVLIPSSTLFVGYMFWAQKIDNVWTVVVFATWMVAMAGIDVFGKWFRGFLDKRVGKIPGTAPLEHESAAGARSTAGEGASPKT